MLFFSWKPDFKFRNSMILWPLQYIFIYTYLSYHISHTCIYIYIHSCSPCKCLKSPFSVTLADIIQLPGRTFGDLNNLLLQKVVPWTDEGNFPSLAQSMAFFSYPIFTISVFWRECTKTWNSWVIWRLYLSRGGMMKDFPIQGDLSEFWVLSQFEFLKIRDFQKRSPTLYTTQIGF